MPRGKPKTVKSSDVAYCRIFPSIGIARLGNSAEYFIGPEVPGYVREPDGGYKDIAGRMKKQGARFRIYAFNATGENLGEVASERGTIKWTVSVANRKADWWPFDGTSNVQHILDKGKPQQSSPQSKRNSTISDDSRARLNIEPSPYTIQGENQVGERMAGQFMDYPEPVALGQCHTDAAGRLIFTGGDGKSDSVLGKDATFLEHYANNDWWFDDTADGPVSAEVTMGGKNIEVKGHAWVIVAPPDFSPFTQNVVTLYDAVLQSYLDLKLAWPEKELGPKPSNKKISFLNDVYPILRRTSDYRWVNERAYRAHGRNRIADFVDFDTLASLAKPSKEGGGTSVQASIFAHIRNPNLPDDSIEAQNQANLSFMPVLSGDEGSIRLGSPERWLKLTKRQYAVLKKWSQGEFENDFPDSEEALSEYNNRVLSLSDYPDTEQPMALIRAALEACEGGAFFPGIEITSIVRNSKFYAEAFRVSENWRAGDVTKWMALPWQADFNDCSDNWWPAVRPDDVIAQDYYDEIVRTLPDAREQGEIYRLLTRRKKWTRGIGVRYGGFEFSSPPGLPAVRRGMTSEQYKLYAEATLRRFANYYRWSLPSLRDGEFADNYLRRVRNFISRTIGGADIPVEDTPPGKIWGVVYEHISDRIPLGPADLEAEAYFARESERVATDPVLTGVFDVVWRLQNEDRVAAKNELVESWSELGVITKRRTASGETVLFETGRDKYARLPWRDYFYILMNIEQYSDFMPKAKELAEEFLQSAREIMNDGEVIGSLRTFFPYSKTALDSRLEAIYETNRQGVANYNPTIDPGLFDTEEKIVERIRQLAPFNQLDGGWLQRVTPAGNATKIQGLLFEIWSDELGNGDPAQNHANIYTNLMRNAGIYYPDIKTKDYAENSEIWDDMFSGPVYHTAISLFPETYFPELIGMTLYLEWEANDLQRMVDLYEYHGYPSLFYKLHVAIDNTVDGHGAAAKKIVELYLDEVRAESGENAVQEHWERIWTGYIAFATGGVQRWIYHLNNPSTPREKVLQLIQRKRHYGALNHHDKKLGPARINALFDEPRMFLSELENSDYIVPGNPDASPFLELTQPDGVMFRVFTDSELEIWKTWIRSLAEPPDGTTLDSGAALVWLLRRMAAKGLGSKAHAGYVLKGPDPRSQLNGDSGQVKIVEETVTWWFQMLRRNPRQDLRRDHHFIAFMHALRDPNNGWIVPGRPEDSRFASELLKDGAMGSRLRNTRPLLGGVRGADILVRWIREGCPDPVISTELTESRGAVAKALGPGEASGKGPEGFSEFSASLEDMLGRRSLPLSEQHRPVRRTSRRKTRLGPAMGSVQ